MCTNKRTAHLTQPIHQRSSSTYTTLPDTVGTVLLSRPKAAPPAAGYGGAEPSGIGWTV